MDWPLVEARTRLDEILAKTQAEGPQRIVASEVTMVLITEAEYAALCEHRGSLVDHLLKMPYIEDLNLARDPSPMREIEL